MIETDPTHMILFYVFFLKRRQIVNIKKGTSIKLYMLFYNTSSGCINMQQAESRHVFKGIYIQWQKDISNYLFSNFFFQG